MRRKGSIALYGSALVGFVVGSDVLFLQHRFLERLLVNVGIVLLFGGLYVKFLKPVWAKGD